jgi:hypothetical protein
VERADGAAAGNGDARSSTAANGEPAAAKGEPTAATRDAGAGGFADAAAPAAEPEPGDAEPPA